jgi:rhamnulokinase
MLVSTSSDASLRAYAAVDLGAGSGRVILGLWDGKMLRIEEVARFRTPYQDDGTLLRWDIRQAFDATLSGLREAQMICQRLGATFAGIGVDSWGVDYGLLRPHGLDLDDVRHHRGAGAPAEGRPEFTAGAAERYAISGVLDQSINTSQQLAVRVDDGSLGAGTLLFIPDLWIYLLSGVVGTDPTIASTSQLLDAAQGTWSSKLVDRLGAPQLALPPVHEAGTIAGETTEDITALIGSPGPVPVIRVAGHDTASALAFASPAAPGATTTGLVSSGTWSLAGLAVRTPVLSERARSLGFTTERNLHGHLMVRNLSGMWLVQECLRFWREAGEEVDIEQLTAEAAGVHGDNKVIDVADFRLLSPGDMPVRIGDLAVESGRCRPTTKAETIRVVLDSLAAAYTRGIDDASDLTGIEVSDIRMVGGGSQSTLLCQLTADRSGKTVIAGPAEATALGNLAVQLLASGECQSIERAYAAMDQSAWTAAEYEPRKAQ